jgi:hypothetical protein
MYCRLVISKCPPSNYPLHASEIMLKFDDKKLYDCEITFYTTG